MEDQKTSIKVAVFSSRSYDQEHFEEQLLQTKSKFKLEYHAETLSKETVKLAKGCEAICTFVHDSLDEDVLKALNELGVKYIAMRCAGTDKLDMSKAKKYQLKVAKVPSYSPNAIAEHGVCLILSLNRKIKKSIDRTREGDFRLDGLVGFDIKDKTVGVIGTGKIGFCLIKMMLGFEAKIMCYDPQPNPDVLNLGLKYSELDEVLKNSDIISLHADLNKDNHNLINEKSIAKMKDNVMLINVARGGLMDTKAVIEGVKSGKIGYLGMDVVENEEGLFFHDYSNSVIKDDNIARLLGFNNVILTGHQAFLTKEALTNLCYSTLQNIEDMRNNKNTPNIMEEN